MWLANGRLGRENTIQQPANPAMVERMTSNWARNEPQKLINNLRLSARSNNLFKRRTATSTVCGYSGHILSSFQSLVVPASLGGLGLSDSVSNAQMTSRTNWPEGRWGCKVGARDEMVPSFIFNPFSRHHTSLAIFFTQYRQPADSLRNNSSFKFHTLQCSGSRKSRNFSDAFRVKFRHFYVSSKRRRLEARNFVILILIPFKTYEKTSFIE